MGKSLVSCFFETQCRCLFARKLADQNRKIEIDKQRLLRREYNSHSAMQLWWISSASTRPSYVSALVSEGRYTWWLVVTSNFVETRPSYVSALVSDGRYSWRLVVTSNFLVSDAQSGDWYSVFREWSVFFCVADEKYLGSKFIIEIFLHE